MQCWSTTWNVIGWLQNARSLCDSNSARRMLAESRHVRGLALKRLVVKHFWLAPVLHIVECRGPAKRGDAILHVKWCCLVVVTGRHALLLAE